jgi:hypothetical protein
MSFSPSTVSVVVVVVIRVNVVDVIVDVIFFIVLIVVTILLQTCRGERVGPFHGLRNDVCRED